MWPKFFTVPQIWESSRKPSSDTYQFHSLPIYAIAVPSNLHFFCQKPAPQKVSGPLRPNGPELRVFVISQTSWGLDQAPLLVFGWKSSTAVRWSPMKWWYSWSPEDHSWLWWPLDFFLQSQRQGRSYICLHLPDRLVQHGWQTFMVPRWWTLLTGSHYVFSGTTMRLTFVFSSAKSPDSCYMRWLTVHTFVFPSGWIVIAMVIWLF